MCCFGGMGCIYSMKLVWQILKIFLSIFSKFIILCRFLGNKIITFTQRNKASSIPKSSENIILTHRLEDTTVGSGAEMMTSVAIQTIVEEEYCENDYNDIFADG